MLVCGAEGDTGRLIATGTEYLGIAGEIHGFEPPPGRGGIAGDRWGLLPGVGFDVLPIDRRTAHLAGRCPAAVQLELTWGPTAERRLARAGLPADASPQRRPDPSRG